MIDGEGLLARLDALRGSRAHLMARIDESTTGEIAETMRDAATAVGLPFASAETCCSTTRRTATLAFAITRGTELRVYLDDTAETRFQLLHRDRRAIVVDSMSDLLEMHADPSRLLDMHLGDDAPVARRETERLGLRPVAPLSLEETRHSLELTAA